MAPPVLRQIGQVDSDLLAALHQRCFTATWDRPWSARSFTEILAMPGASGQIVSMGDEPLGFGMTLQAASDVEILLLAVLPEARGQGLGRVLLDRLMSAATAQGAARALLEVAQSNRAAISCYMKAGFTACGRRQQYYPGPIDAVLFEKTLNSLII